MKIKSVGMDKKLKKLLFAAHKYQKTCEQWEYNHYSQIIQDCETWIAGEQYFDWDEVMKLANTYWSDCRQ